MKSTKRMAFKLTDQQEEILKSFKKGKNLRINAFAWTGKTTMLKLIVEDNPTKKFLVLVFNKSVQQELEKKFPKNASVYTINSFAYNKVKNYQHTEFRVVDEKDIILELRKEPWITYTKAKIIMDVFSKYCDSDIVNINESTMKELIEKDLLLTEYFNRHKATLSYKYIATRVTKIFDKMIRGNLPFTHSWYLKYFQLLFDKYFKSECKFDAVMLDEWQDTNLVSLSIFKKFDSQKIIVWDTHQWIYWWRWAVNAMESLNFESHYITKSFRINKDTADKWNKILKNYKLENRPLESYYAEWWECKWTSCTIFRTNAWIIHYLFNKFNNWEDFDFRCTRKIEDIFWMALDFENLYNYYKTWEKWYLKRIKDWRVLFLSEIGNDWEKLWKLLEEKIDDYDLKANYTLLGTIESWIDWHWTETLIREVCDRISWNHFEWEYVLISCMYKQAKDSYNEASQNTLSTAHSVKWLEFDKVTIEDDFPSIYWELYKYFVSNETWIKSICRDKNYHHKINDTLEAVEDLFYDNKKNSNSVEMRSIVEEVNLMYVAITRAIKKLEINSKWIEELLATPKEKFKQHLMYKITEYATWNIKLCKQLLKTNFKNIFTLRGFSYELLEPYTVDTVSKVAKWRNKSKTIKKINDKLLVIPYKYSKSWIVENSKLKRQPTGKIDLTIESDWILYNTKAKIDKAWSWLKWWELNKDQKFLACCFDIKESVQKNWKLIIKINSKKRLKDWIIINLENIKCNNVNLLEVESLKTPKTEPIPKKTTNIGEKIIDKKDDEQLKKLQEKANKIRKWLIAKDKPYYYFVDYKAAGQISDAMLDSDQKKVLYFKRWYAQYRNEVVEEVTNFINKNFKERDNIALICIPASKKAENKTRYEGFCKYVCKKLWIKNGFEHVKIIKEKEKKHTWNEATKISDWLEFNVDYFKDKYVIIFDDVITDWKTMNEVWDILQSDNIWAKPFLWLAIGKTIKQKPKDPLIDK